MGLPLSELLLCSRCQIGLYLFQAYGLTMEELFILFYRNDREKVTSRLMGRVETKTEA